MWDKKGGNILAEKSLNIFRVLSKRAGASLQYNKKVTKL
jgi:hypothetical protein